MAERPQRLVREAVVIALLFLFIEPHATETVLGIVRRHVQPISPFHDVSIRSSGPVSDPDAATCFHHRLQGGDDATRRAFRERLAIEASIMSKRLAVREHHDAISVTTAFQTAAQAAERPDLVTVGL
jgi:hypothetical protein